MKDKIILRLDTSIRNMDNENFEELFPMILDDLIYILDDFKNDREALSSEEQFNFGAKFNKKISVYIAKLAKVYFKVIYGLDINVINCDDYNMAMAGGGYNSKDGNIYYSDFGVMLSRQSDLSFLHTCLHEGRHKMQHNFYEIDDLLSFPPYMLRLLKENLLEDSLQENNRAFYRANYDILFTENDAEIFARQEIYSFINNMAQMYVISYNKSLKEINKLATKINKLNGLFINILNEENFNIRNKIAIQMQDCGFVNCNYEVLGQCVDGLIIMDKYIKAHPELKEQYPILRLLFNGDMSKGYEEIMIDKANFKKNRGLEEQKRIDELYDQIIILDPILDLTDKLERGDIRKVKEYLDLHPTIISEYPEEIKLLKEKYNYFNSIFDDDLQNRHRR